MRKNQIPVVCKTCGKGFTAAPSLERKYCSTDCAYQSKERSAHIKPKERGEATCAWCGNVFKIRRKGGKTYCSQPCAAQKIGKETMAKNRANPPRTRFVEKPCKTCGENFKSWASHERLFCSTRCSGEDADGKKTRIEALRAKPPTGNAYSRCSNGWAEIGGKRFFSRSLWERNYANYLQWQKERGEILDWEYEAQTFWFDKIKRGVRSCLPDFKVTVSSGVEWHEVKGWMDSRSKTRLRRMKKYYPKEVVVLRDEHWFKRNGKTLAAIIPGWELKAKSLKGQS